MKTKKRRKFKEEKNGKQIFENEIKKLNDENE